MNGRLLILAAGMAAAPLAHSAPGTEGTKPLPPEEALQSFRTPPGLTLELVVCEPLVIDPVAIDWAADGSLWVCEMHDYPSGLDGHGQAGGRVRHLQDLDHDGRLETATIFADGLPYPTGVMAWADGVFICAAPDILYARDTNHDGRADKVEVCYTGFYTDNYQARVNGLSLGLDNWIYGANGLLGGTIKGIPNHLFPQPGPEQPLNIRGHDFRFSPWTGAFEMVGGLTQQGRVRDDWGNWFGCDNTRALLSFPVPERYAARNPGIPSPAQVRPVTTANQLYPASPLLERFNEPASANHVTSACGLGIYRDTLLGGEYYSNAFTCEPVHNLVHREILEGEIAFTSHRAAAERESEFLASTDNWFRPVQARTGPDGALYIVDMYRFLIEHPRWITPERLAQIDPRAGSDRGRIYRLRPKGVPLRTVADLTKLEGAELARQLDSPNGTERDRVHARLLATGEGSSANALRKLTRESTLPQVRLQALAALAGLNELDEPLLAESLRDPNPYVRAQAVLLGESILASARAETQASTLIEKLLPLAKDPSQIVRRQLAFSLGESSNPKAGEMLAELMENSGADKDLRFAVLSSASNHAPRLLRAARQIRDASLRAEWMRPLAGTASRSPDPAVATEAFDMALRGDGESTPAERIVLVSELLRGLERSQRKIDEILANRPDLISKIREFGGTARRLAGSAGTPEKVRLAALDLFGRIERNEDEIAMACELVATSGPQVRSAALGALQRTDSPEVATRLLALWKGMSPEARSEAFQLLLSREEWIRPVLRAIQEGLIARWELSLTEQQRLKTSGSAEIRRMAREIMPETAKRTSEDRSNLREAVLACAGDSARGAVVFEQNCGPCHRLHEIGHAVGPDLALLRDKDPDYWLKNIFEPSAAIEPRFVSYEIELNDGRTLTGLISNESAAGFRVLMPNGFSEDLSRAAVRGIRASTLSLMPEGFDQALDARNLADLLAFLRSTTAPPR